MKQYIQPVKKQFRNISFLVLSAVLLALATALTFGLAFGLQEIFANSNSVVETNQDARPQ